MLGMWIQNIRVTVGKDPEKTEVLGLLLRFRGRLG